jgi:hypothetical protein
VTSDIFPACVAATIPKEPRHGFHRADIEPVTEDIPWHARPTSSIPVFIPQHCRLPHRRQLRTPATASRRISAAEGLNVTGTELILSRAEALWALVPDSKWGNPSTRQLNRGRLRGSCGILPTEEAQNIGGRELIAEMRPQHSGPKPAQVLVEVAPDRHEIADVDACRAAPRMQALGGHPSGGIAVAGDIEPREHRRELQRREMIGRQRGDHGHAGQHAFERQHGLDAFAGEQHCFRGGRLGGGPRAGG